jgi:hypothetical protein
MKNWYRLLVPIFRPDMLISAQHALDFRRFALTGTNFNDIDDETRMNAGDIAFYRRYQFANTVLKAKLFEARLSDS